MAADVLEFAFPLPRTHCGVALGNGNFGALVWGAERLCITVNRADWWDHRGGEVLLEGNDYERLKAAYDPADGAALNAAFIRERRPPGVLRSQRLPAGRLEFELAAGHVLRCASLETETGRLVVTIDPGDGSAAKRVVIVVCPECALLVVADPEDALARAHARPAWEWVGDELAQHAFEPPRVLDAPLTGWVQPCPADPALAVVCRSVEVGYALALGLGDDAEAALDEAEQLAHCCAAGEFEGLLARTAAWWHDFWHGAAEIELPDAWYQRFYRYALWKLGCATSPLSPRPAGLQGPWVEEYQLTPWSGDYHFNVNIQQIYTLCFPTGRLDHLLPLFDLVDSFREVMRHTAKVLVGIDDGLALPHAVDDRGHACGGISSGAILDQAVSGWTAQLYWLYWRHTLDEAFLRERAWPFLRGVMRTYEAMLEERDGRLSLPLGISAEYAQPLPGGKRQNAGLDPSYQLACMHMLAEALLEAAEVLGEPPSPMWRRIREELPPYTLIGPNEDRRIAIWEGQDLDICHRHHSHLACIYPFDSLGEWTDEHRLVLDNSVDHWILKGMGQWSEWCYPWAAILQARMGFTESPRVLLNIWREVFLNEGLATAYLPRFRGLTAHRRADLVKPKETTEIMQLDGTMAGATALLELLIHERAGTVHLFPAVPECWPDVAFRHVRVPGGFAVSAERRSGHTARVQVRSQHGGTLRLASDADWLPREVTLASGEEREWEVRG